MVSNCHKPMTLTLQETTVRQLLEESILSNSFVRIEVAEVAKLREWGRREELGWIGGSSA